MRRRIRGATFAVMFLALTAGMATAQICPGDNNQDGMVTVDEIVAAVQSALEGCPGPSERFADNGDGTITDNETGLIWEKKVKLDSTTDLANLQDADNSYSWSGTCSLATSKRCQANAAAAAACFAGVEGDKTGCDECTGGDGVCNVSSPGITIWQWLNDLNTANYGGHNDWRMPRWPELQAIVDYADNVAPTVNVAFHGVSCGEACADVSDPACACTRSNDYWSASTYAPDPDYAWDVFFTGDGVHVLDKTDGISVRAVRGGS